MERPSEDVPRGERLADFLCSSWVVLFCVVWGLVTFSDVASEEQVVIFWEKHPCLSPLIIGLWVLTCVGWVVVVKCDGSEPQEV